MNYIIIQELFLVGNAKHTQQIQPLEAWIEKKKLNGNQHRHSTHITATFLVHICRYT